MAKNKTPMSDEAILTRIVGKVQSATSESKTSRETERVQRYYDQELPRRTSDGNSSYVSSDVFDAVESMKAQLLEVFAGGHDIIRFLPHRDEEATVAAAETKWVEHVVHDKNKGFEIFQDWIDDGLKTRRGIVQAYWENCIVYDEHTFKGMSLADVQALASQDDVEDLEANLDAPEGSEDTFDPSPEEATFSGSWRRRIDKSRVKIENVPSEEYFSEESKKSREDGVRGRRMLKSRADLIADGFDKTKVNAATAVTNDTAQEKQARDNPTNDAFSMADDPVSPEMELVEVFETYVRLDIDGGRPGLYKITHSDKHIFDKEEVDEDPFVSFTPLRRPHSQQGNNFAARVIQTQNARTVLTRAILDHTAITTNPRWQVLNGAVTNPKELLDNRRGGIVNVRQREGIMPLQYPNLNPFVFETLQMLKDNKEENTGISALSQGLNKDAISSQNSQGLVSDLVSLSQVRQKIIARNFANCLAELYLKVRKLSIEFEKKERIAQVVDEFELLDPKLWHPERPLKVSLHVGYGEQEKEAAKFAQLWGLLTQDPVASQWCSPPKQHKLLSDGLRKNGFANYADYIIRPEEWKAPPPDELKVKELEIKSKTADAALASAQASQRKVDSHEQLEVLKAQLAKMTLDLKRIVDLRAADRQDLDVANRVDVSQREVEMLENAPPEAENAIVSPQG